ncbi:hypothetical protein H2203_007359 [Taxawa tesnikishii (nom. ined.)]|nr:hypothetical protein H2203_007359 [Dothideales sp. JES 119]
MQIPCWIFDATGAIIGTSVSPFRAMDYIMAICKAKQLNPAMAAKKQLEQQQQPCQHSRSSTQVVGEPAHPAMQHNLSSPRPPDIPSIMGMQAPTGMLRAGEQAEEAAPQGGGRGRRKKGKGKQQAIAPTPMPTPVPAKLQFQLYPDADGSGLNDAYTAVAAEATFAALPTSVMQSHARNMMFPSNTQYPMPHTHSQPPTPFAPMELQQPLGSSLPAVPAGRTLTLPQSARQSRFPNVGYKPLTSQPPAQRYLRMYFAETDAKVARIQTKYERKPSTGKRKREETPAEVPNRLPIQGAVSPAASTHASATAAVEDTLSVVPHTSEGTAHDFTDYMTLGADSTATLLAATEFNDSGAVFADWNQMLSDETQKLNEVWEWKPETDAAIRKAGFTTVSACNIMFLLENMYNKMFWIGQKRRIRERGCLRARKG